MSPARRLAVLTASSLVTLVLTAPGPGPADPRWLRLTSMPREERVRLAENLKTFDALGRDEQKALRTLDRAIAAEPEENRATYEAVLRRYHLWLRELTKSQRDQIAGSPPEKRMALVYQLLAEQRAAKRPEPFIHRVADFGGKSPYELASLIKIWLKLSPQEQAEVSKLPEDQRRLRMLMLAREHRIKPVERPTREEIDALFEKAVNKNRHLPIPKKAEEKQQIKFKQHVAEYYSFVEHPPAKVLPDKLYLFDRSLPSWLRSGFEDAPPGEARWLLTNLYRLIFRAPEEIEAAKPAAAKATVPGKPAAGAPPAHVPIPPKNVGPPPAKPAGPANPF